MVVITQSESLECQGCQQAAEIAFLNRVKQSTKRKISNISMVVICYASDTIEYDGRTPELSNAALYMEEDANIIENR